MGQDQPCATCPLRGPCVHTRQKSSHSMGGFVGEIELEGDLAPFLPLLHAAQTLHVGKGATFGLGKVEIA